MFSLLQASNLGSKLSLPAGSGKQGRSWTASHSAGLLAPARHRAEINSHLSDTYSCFLQSRGMKCFSS